MITWLSACISARSVCWRSWPVLAQVSVQRRWSIWFSVYEHQHEWGEAIAIGERLLRERPEFSATLAHYHCELAAQALQRPMRNGICVQR
ncbi:hypothetical protein ULF88_01920 [Halopseudomonas pachastrellae]|nr:hypothetical protein [Halopseudomonas pachastrellae]